MGITFDQIPWYFYRKLFLTALLNLRKPPSLQVVMF